MKKIYKALNHFTMTGKISLGVIIVIVLIGVFADFLAVYPYNIPAGRAFEAPGSNHWLGTDDLGIDIWAQICAGARISIIVGFFTALLAGVGGSMIGILAGYLGGITDKIMMRITDMMIVLPDLPMMIVLGAFFGPSMRNIILVLSLFSWTLAARIVRSKIISIKQEQYILAAKSYGANFFHLTINHFFPQVMPVMAVSMIRLVGRAIVAEAGLAFLGLGDPTSKSWGLIINHAINFSGIYFTPYWKWWVISPLVAITLMVTAIAFVGRELEKVLNTKL